MALQKSFDLENTGVFLPNAYHVIRKIETFKIESGYISNISISIYSSQEARQSGKDPVIENLISMMGYSFNYDLSSQNNILAQAYDYLKTLPEYQGSTDV